MRPMRDGSAGCSYRLEKAVALHGWAEVRKVDLIVSMQ